MATRAVKSLRYGVIGQWTAQSCIETSSECHIETSTAPRNAERRRTITGVVCGCHRGLWSRGGMCVWRDAITAIAVIHTAMRHVAAMGRGRSALLGWCRD